MNRTKTGKTVWRVVALLAAMTVVAAFLWLFSACGETHLIITLYDGDEGYSTVLTDENGYVTLPVPEKAGYIFNGWYTDPELRNRYDQKDRFWGNASLYIGWISRTYEITFKFDGGYVTDADGEISTDDIVLKVKSGEILSETPSKIPSPERDHYEFGGWTRNNVKVDFDEPFEYAANVTFIAVWTPHTSAITYLANGGTIINSSGESVSAVSARQTVSYDSEFMPAYSARKEGYQFVDWIILDEQGAETADRLTAGEWKTEENFTVSARYRANTYTVTFSDPPEGMSDTLHVTYDAPYDISAYENTSFGYVFDHWEYTLRGETHTLSLSTGNAWKIAGDVVLTPQYRANEYTLTLYLEDKSDPYATVDVAYGNILTGLPAPSAEGKIFIGWYTSGGVRLMEGALWDYNRDVAATAVFADPADAVPFTTEYYLENGDGTYSLAETYSGYGRRNAVIGINLDDFDSRYEDYTFLASFADTGLGIANSPASAELTDEVTLRYYFQRDVYTCTFVSDGITLEPLTRRWGQEISLLPDGEITVKRGYELTGWSVNGELITDKTMLMPKNDVELVAQWRKKTYTVVLDGREAFTVEYEADVSSVRDLLLLEDTAANEFTGWLMNGTKVLGLSDISSLSVWTIDSTVRRSDGTYAVELTSDWQAITAGYTINIYMENADGTFDCVSAETLTGEIGSTVAYYAAGNVPENYVYDYTNPKNVPVTQIVGDGSAALNIYYKRAEYTVIYRTESEILAEISVGWGKPLPDIVPEIEGYIFGGWLDGNGGAFTGTAMPADDLTLTAKLTAKTYRLVFENGGAFDGATEAVYGERYSSFADVADRLYGIAVGDWFVSADSLTSDFVWMIDGGVPETEADGTVVYTMTVRLLWKSEGETA